jgi:hypothetical protein
MGVEIGIVQVRETAGDSTMMNFARSEVRLSLGPPAAMLWVQEWPCILYSQVLL